MKKGGISRDVYILNEKLFLYERNDEYQPILLYLFQVQTCIHVYQKWSWDALQEILGITWLGVICLFSAQFFFLTT